MRKYCYVFFVTHKYFVMVDAEGDDVNEVKEIGVYASHQLAQCATERFAGLPGFSSYPDRFIISKVRCYLGTSDKKADLSVLYSPYYEAYLPESDCDFVSRGLFYENQADAEAVLQRWKQDPKFRHANGEYAAVEYELNKDSRFWSEGFS